MTDMHTDNDKDIDFHINSGVCYIKHLDKWQGECYLTENMEFTTNKSYAAKFYLLGIASTNNIFNGDMVTINCGYKIISVNTNGIQLLNRTDLTDSIQTFRITTGYQDDTVISYGSPISFILDTKEHLALKYDYTVDLTSHRSRENLHRLSIGDCSDNIDPYMFYIERCDSPSISLHSPNHLLSTSSSPDYKNIIVLCSLMLLLCTCIIISSKIR